ncbi:flagellar hook assembly protein FlgD [Salipaludibacillus daqingensis]|uniref:flagellar hook assembly protein FlgD n=1 Tax=Salipaludibacillus daqingensis TaxID=3041001 RepID=UPI0024756EFD|nr:flagellar hook assembly protein FlgD [Salipaludibacillus daqingensis]
MPINTQVTESLYHAEYMQKQKEKNAGSQELGKDAFLKILLTQLQNQDPMNPMEDQEFIAQMAQFSSLEQMTNMNENLQKFMDMQKRSDFVSHSDLIGKKVEWEKVLSKDDQGKPKETEKLDGIVTSVVFKDGQAKLVIDGDEKVSAKDLLSVTNP